jgi:peptidoglycan hydrolase-like protein with peptidoglycan-binding domain
MGSLRRIIGLGDSGEDVRIVQQMLNLLLSLPKEYMPREPGYPELSERIYPDLWGYYWGEGARARYASRHQDPYRLRRPVYQPPQNVGLADDGKFGPKTEAAVIRFQRRCGIPTMA